MGELVRPSRRRRADLARGRLSTAEFLLLSEPPINQVVSLTIPDPADDSGGKVLPGGEVPANWAGLIELKTSAKDWDLQASITDGTTVFNLDRSAATPAATRFKPKDGEAQKFKDWFALLPHGGPIRAEVSASKSQAFTIKGHRQLAVFVVRAAKGALPSPFAPRWLTFEDPEYNRQLASAVARSEKVITVGTDIYTVAIVSDRREYNPNSKLVVVFSARNQSGDVVQQGSASVSFAILDKLGNPGSPIDYSLNLTINTIPPAQDCDLNVILKGKQLPPGSILRLSMKAKIKDADVPQVDLDVNIVTEPVTPVPEAGYALLRRTNTGAETVDECAAPIESRNWSRNWEWRHFWSELDDRISRDTIYVTPYHGTHCRSVVQPKQGMVSLLDPASGKTVGTLHFPDDSPRQVTISPDARRIASREGNGTLRLWDVKAGREIALLRIVNERINHAIFSPGGERLATWGPAAPEIAGFGRLRVWDTNAGREIPGPPAEADGDWEEEQVAFSPDGSRVAFPAIRLWNITSGIQVRVAGPQQDVKVQQADPHHGHENGRDD
jgi:hypothetical protein